ncbi:MAG TPA: hypothetical protein VG347_17715 [Verrucomicrobiae bacterium]|nr:hypothetical protein [Verrucomicrobiae bacterium]
MEQLIEEWNNLQLASRNSESEEAKSARFREEVRILEELRALGFGSCTREMLNGYQGHDFEGIAIASAIQDRYWILTTLSRLQAR